MVMYSTGRRGRCRSSGRQQTYEHCSYVVGKGGGVSGWNGWQEGGPSSAVVRASSFVRGPSSCAVHAWSVAVRCAIRAPSRLSSCAAVIVRRRRRPSCTAVMPRRCRRPSPSFIVACRRSSSTAVGTYRCCSPPFAVVVVSHRRASSCAAAVVVHCCHRRALLPLLSPTTAAAAAGKLRRSTLSTLSLLFVVGGDVARAPLATMASRWGAVVGRCWGSR